MTATTAVSDTSFAASSTIGPHALPGDALAAGLGVEPARGLTDAQVAARLAQHGPNRLTEQPPRPA